MTDTAGPLGGSYFVEALTDRMEKLAYEYFRKIDDLGGMVEAVKHGYPQREIADAAFQLQQEIDAGRRVVVGVNSFTEATTRRRRSSASILRSSAARSQSCARSRRGATPTPSSNRWTALREATSADRNLMPPLLDAARAHATEGEIVSYLQELWGSYRESPAF